MLGRLHCLGSPGGGGSCYPKEALVGHMGKGVEVGGAQAPQEKGQKRKTERLRLKEDPDLVRLFLSQLPELRLGKASVYSDGGHAQWPCRRVTGERLALSYVLHRGHPH